MMMAMPSDAIGQVFSSGRTRKTAEGNPGANFSERRRLINELLHLTSDEKIWIG